LERLIAVSTASQINEFNPFSFMSIDNAASVVPPGLVTLLRKTDGFSFEDLSIKEDPIIVCIDNF
jgi:hypothetical protein